MKHIFSLLLGVLMISSCSSPKYTYHFDHYDYNSGKKKSAESLAVAGVAQSANEVNATATEESILTIEKEALIASIETNVVPTVMDAPKQTLAQNYKELSRTEKKAFRKELKEEIKSIVKAKKEGQKGAIGMETKAMDHDLKMAIIFGAIALTLSFFGGVNYVFWIISVVALVVGVVFFIKWLAEM